MRSRRVGWGAGTAEDCGGRAGRLINNGEGPVARRGGPTVSANLCTRLREQLSGPVEEGCFSIPFGG